MYKNYLVIAAWLGALSVAMGAFGAHSLKDMVTPALLNTYETAVRYQFYHVFALALTGILYQKYPNKRIRYAGIFFMSGILLFCGSLYLLIFLNDSGFRWLGAITPLGGVFFIAGWVALAMGVGRDNNTSD